MGRVSRQQAAANRAGVVAAASAMFRRRGLDGVGIDALMAEAGLTRGGFYGQFGSKEALAGEACTHAFDEAERAWEALAEDGAGGRRRGLVGWYLGARPSACPMATLAGDAARAPAGGAMRLAFTAGLQRLARSIAGERRDEKGLALLAAMVGAVVLRRASEDEALADAIDAAVLRMVEVEARA
jgi:TetR/AcrR family transcriptional repressor of nem operon